MGLCITSITADIKMCNTRSFTTRSSVYFHGKYANLSNAYVYSRVVYGRVRGKYANFRWRMVTFTMCSKMLMEHIFEFIKKSTVSPVKFIDHFHPSKEFYAFRSGTTFSEPSNTHLWKICRFTPFLAGLQFLSSSVSPSSPINSRLSHLNSVRCPYTRLRTLHKRKKTQQSQDYLRIYDWV